MISNPENRLIDLSFGIDATETPDYQSMKFICVD
jgi:hypothetical protein